jgi:hypothetical protein
VVIVAPVPKNLVLSYLMKEEKHKVLGIKKDSRYI